MFYKSRKSKAFNTAKQKCLLHNVVFTLDEYTMYSLPVWQRDNWPVWTVDISAHPLILSHLSCCSPHTKIKADTSQLITNPIDLPGTQNPLKRNWNYTAEPVNMAGYNSKIISRPHAGLFLLIYIIILKHSNTNI